MIRCFLAFQLCFFFLAGNLIAENAAECAKQQVQAGVILSLSLKALSELEITPNAYAENI